MTSTVTYNGELRTTCLHLASGNSIITDAPIDNHGKGEAFSPTDLVATALGACMLTVMGIKAAQMQLNLDGTRCEITKIIGSEPRRISGIVAKLEFPANGFTEKEKTILENTAKTCPVHYSLHPEINQDVQFIWL